MFFPVAFIIGDALSGDQLCGWYRNYSPNVIHLSRCCDVHFTESSNTNWKCQYLYMSDVQERCLKAMQLCDLIEKDNPNISDIEEEDANDINIIMTELQQMSTHMHETAFQNIWFGANPHRIYGTVPTDLMHAFLHGIIPYVIKTIISPFTNKEKHYLNDLVDQTLVTIHSSERTKYPRCSFTHGISNLKLLTATEWASVAFTVALMMTTQDGYKLFNKVSKRWEKNRRNIQMVRKKIICQM